MSDKKTTEETKQIDTTKKADEPKKDSGDVMKDDKGVPLTDSDIRLFKRYGKGPYTEPLKKVEAEIKDLNQRIVNIQGIKESDTGLSMPSQWNIEADKQMMKSDPPLQVGRLTKIMNPGTPEAKYIVAFKHQGKYVVGLGKDVAPTDVEEGMRVGCERIHAIGSKVSIMLPLPPKIDPTVTMMTVEDKPDVTYNDLGGCKE